MSSSVIESIFAYNFVRKRQLEAPLLRERELFLMHLLEQGTSKAGGPFSRNNAFTHCSPFRSQRSTKSRFFGV